MLTIILISKFATFFWLHIDLSIDNELNNLRFTRILTKKYTISIENIYIL